MLSWISRYAKWLHLRWPSGTVEKLPVVDENGATNVVGLYVVGDLTGIPLLKFSADTGTRVIRTIVDDDAFRKRDQSDDTLDVVIVGGGVSGFAAALEAKKQGLRFKLFEAAEPFSTIVNFPKAKPIYTYPTDMTPAGDLQFHDKSDVKEGLLEDLREQTIDAGIEPVRARVEKVVRQGGRFEVAIPKGESVRAYRVVVAIGRSGNFRKLGVPGEELDKVYNRLHDPKDFCGKKVLVVGGGDSALETAIVLGACGSDVTVSYRKPEFARPKPENVERLNELAEGNGEGVVRLEMKSSVKAIRDDAVVLDTTEGDKTIDNDVVFSMIGREPPLDFFRKSGVAISGEWRTKTIVSFILTVLAFVFIYHWKKSGTFLPVFETFEEKGWFPFNMPDVWAGLGKSFADPATILGTLRVSLGEPGFYYSLAYCVCVVLFGLRRIKRRKTPYVKVQTFTLAAIQVIPLFLLPYLILPLFGNNGWFEEGFLATVADEFFPRTGGGHGREYWRSLGFILAWPLFFWNVFTSQPLWGWLIVSFVQTFVVIPLLIRKWGKGVYCGWICSCGALAETMGDAHRHKMPHGPLWNRMNFIGQAFLVFTFVLLGLRIGAWAAPESWLGAAYDQLLYDLPVFNYVWFVDLLFAGIIGVGFYFHFSGRVWCRFACPLAALMHIYARFSKFRIFSEKKKCISCNVCTSVCHQGIDVMNFANKGVPMEDPECVRCSACVGSCPTGTLSFGEIDPATGEVAKKDKLAASPVLMKEASKASSRQMGSIEQRVPLLAVMLGAVVIGLLVLARVGGDPSRVGEHEGATSRATSRQSGGSGKSSGAQSEPAAKRALYDGPRTTDVDHVPFDRVLKRRVREGRVAYLEIRDHDLETLDTYLDALVKVDHTALERAAGFAFYTNLYNATVIREVIRRYHDAYSAAENDYALFNDETVRLWDGRVSLDHLEKKMMWDAFAEPRMHVTLVCAAVSCPPIIPRAYVAADLEEVLETNMRRFVAEGTRNEIDVANRSMRLSQIFNWYARDFGGEAEVPKYVDRYHAADVADFSIAFKEYDWSLNIVR